MTSLQRAWDGKALTAILAAPDTEARLITGLQLFKPKVGGRKMPRLRTSYAANTYSGSGSFNANRFWKPEDATTDLPPVTQDVRALHFDADGRKIETTESENGN